MIDYKIRFTPVAAGFLSKSHPDNKKQIKEVLKDIKDKPYAGYDLQDELYGFKAFKSNRYRLIYKINDESKYIEIYYIGHRRDVYEQFRSLLNQMK